MMELVNSKEKLLDGATIITYVAKRLVKEGQDFGQTLAAVAAEMSMKGSESVQIGNTVFLLHRGKGDNRNKAHGRAFNMDTVGNMANNGIKYIEWLRKRGITHYSTDFRGKEYLNFFMVMGKKLKQAGLDTEIYVARNTTDGNAFRAYIRVGKQPLPEIKLGV